MADSTYKTALEEAENYFLSLLTRDERCLLNLINEDVMSGPVYILTDPEGNPLTGSGDKTQEPILFQEISMFEDLEDENQQATPLFEINNFKRICQSLKETLNEVDDVFYFDWNPENLYLEDPGLNPIPCEECAGTGFKDEDEEEFCDYCAGFGVEMVEDYWIIEKREILLKLAYADALRMLGVYC